MAYKPPIETKGILDQPAHTPAVPKATQAYQRSVTAREEMQRALDAARPLHIKKEELPTDNGLSQVPVRTRTPMFGRTNAVHSTRYRGFEAPKVSTGAAGTVEGLASQAAPNLAPTGAQVTVPTPSTPGSGTPAVAGGSTLQAQRVDSPTAITNTGLTKVEVASFPPPTGGSRTYGAYLAMLSTRGIQWDIKAAYDEWSKKGLIPAIKSSDLAWEQLLTTHEVNMANTNAQAGAQTGASNEVRRY